MKHLFASCAVIALMAAPALAQSTIPTTDPFTEREVDPAISPGVTTETPAETELETTFETEAEPAEEALPVEDAETPVDETDAAVTEPDEMSSTATDATEEETTVAEAEPVFQIQDEAQIATVESAELPEDYSTDDLNAMILAQLNTRAEEIATIAFVPDETEMASADTSMDVTAETETYASTETDTYVTPEPDSAEAVTPEESTAQEYAATDTFLTPESEVAATNAAPEETVTEEYAAAETEVTHAEEPATTEMYASTEAVDPAIDMEAEVVAEGEAADTMMAETETMTSDGMTAEGDVDQTAVEIAAGDARFSTLVELVGLAGLEDELSGEGPYTVLAPTNDAFAALPEGTLAHLKSEEGREELTALLKAHVIEGAVMAEAVPLTGEEVETLGAKSVAVMGSTDGTLNVGGTINTVGDGIFASNGVVYAVDAVILPEVVWPEMPPA